MTRNLLDYVLDRLDRGEEAVPQQPRPERLPYSAPLRGAMGGPVNPEFDPCGAPPLNAESTGEQA